MARIARLVAGLLAFLGVDAREVLGQRRLSALRGYDKREEEAQQPGDGASDPHVQREGGGFFGAAISPRSRC